MIALWLRVAGMNICYCFLNRKTNNIAYLAVKTKFDCNVKVGFDPDYNYRGRLIKVKRLYIA